MNARAGTAEPHGGGERSGVSIIIPHLNQHDALVRCLHSLLDQTFLGGDVEIIVVDNGSRDPHDGVATAFPVVRFLAEANPGPGLARNRGVAAARGEILLFIDADCRADPRWITSAVAALTGDEPPPIIGGDVRIDVANPAHLTALEAYESVFAYRQLRYITRDGFSGTGNLATSRAVFDTVGPFGGIGIAEDRDWGQRAKSAGYATRYIPDMIIFHPARKTLDDLKHKWRRHVAHDLAKHRGEGKSALRWGFLGLGVCASILPHSLMTLRSPRLTGIGNRLRAIGVLIRIRLFRCAEMVRQFSAVGDHSATRWNR